jgi:Spy/CpxP family protein refolding chaperone
MRLRAEALAILTALTAIALPAAAQQQPYAGQQERDIKALSADEVKQYLAGAGMGYAKAAELNRFPGPLHALELAEELRLTGEQRKAIQALMDAHKAEARGIGAKLLEAERALEDLFRSGNVSQAALAQAVAQAASLEAAYRLSHLEMHRRLRPLLTDEQAARYHALRGYGAAGGHPAHKH